MFFGGDKMKIDIDQNLTIEVYFDILDREEGFEDDIRFALRQTGPKEYRLFPADEIGFLLTPEQADQLATALTEAAQASRSVPRREE